MTTISSLELRSKITSEARLELWLEKVTLPKPAADEVVVRIDAAPLNPSDIILLLGPAEPASIQAGGTPTHPTASANIPLQHMPGLKARLDKALPVGNEGAGNCAGRSPGCVFLLRGPKLPVCLALLTAASLKAPTPLTLSPRAGWDASLE